MLACSRVPNSGCTVKTGASQALTIRTEGDMDNLQGMPLQGQQFFTRGGIPDFSGGVKAPGRQAGAIWTEGNTDHNVCMPGRKGENFTACLRIPDFCRSIITCRSNPGAICTEGDPA